MTPAPDTADRPAAAGNDAPFRCGVCGHQAGTHVLRGRDRQHLIPGEWDLARCDACNLVQMHPQPRPEEVPDFYPKVYYAHRATQGTFRKVKVSGVKRFVLRHVYGHPPGRGPLPMRLLGHLLAQIVSRKNLLPWVGEGRMLDVGCGVGSAIWRLQAYGWKVQGVEIDGEAAEVGRQNGLTIHAGELHDAKLPRGSLDLVRMSHVLEHALDPVATLREVRDILQPNGRAWIAVPNIGSANLPRFGPNWFPLELPRHLYHFDQKTLREICRRAGLDVVSVRYRSTTDGFTRSLEYDREDTFAARGEEVRGKPMYKRKWVKRMAGLRMKWQDLMGRGDIMEFTCTPAGKAGGAN